MLRVKNVSKCLNDKLIINNISFDIEEGEIVSLLGNNGSGKTTTIKLLANLLIKDKGEISISGKDVTIKDIGYLPEERSLYYDCRVYEQLEVLADIAKLEDKETLIEYYLKKVGLLERKDSLISELSKGNQQKLAMISALLKGPRILLLDEPFTGLDKENIKLFENLIKEYYTSKRIVIISSHIYDPINQYCNRFIVLKDGEVIENKTINELNEDNRRIVITEKDVELRDYALKLEEGNRIKYVFSEPSSAIKAIRWMNKNEKCNYEYRHLLIEDMVNLHL